MSKLTKLSAMADKGFPSEQYSKASYALAKLALVLKPLTDAERKRTLHVMDNLDRANLASEIEWRAESYILAIDNAVTVLSRIAKWAEEQDKEAAIS